MHDLESAPQQPQYDNRDHATLNHQMTVPDQDAWEAWSPAELARRLDGVSRPWCVVGGWSLDLWHEKITLEHDDLEFAVLREDFAEVRQKLSDMEFYSVRDGELELLQPHEEPSQKVFQIWCFDRIAMRWRADIMIEPGTDEIWIYKRDPQVTRPRTEMVALTADRIPYLNPSAVLLFKAKYCRAKDEQDFANAAPHLSSEERGWLRDCLQRLHPGHAWAKRL